MDNTILNGSKIRLYNLGNSESGSIQYTDSKLSIKGNSAGSGVLITDGKLHLRNGDSTSSIIYDSNTLGVQFPDGLIIIGTGSNTSSIYNDNGNVHIDSGITVSNLNIEHTEGVAANILGRVQFGSGLATGEYSHALGTGTQAIGDYSHALGSGTAATGVDSHALGNSTQATGNSSHALGILSATGKRIYALLIIPAESFSLIISNASTYFEPGQTLVLSDDTAPICPINITNVTANAITASCSSDYISSEFYYIISNRYPYKGYAAHALGLSTQASGYSSHALGTRTQATGDYSHAEGQYTIASGSYSHALGDGTQAIGGGSHALGSGTIASGDGSHALGYSTQAIGWYSHALGLNTTANGYVSHVLGSGTVASGYASHALGSDNITIGDYSHALGRNTTANGDYSHALGRNTIASGYASHALGLGTTTSIGYQHATGKYNAVDNNAIFIVGTGSSVGSRANGFWVTLTGLANAGLGFSSSGYLKIGSDITAAQDISSPVYIPGFDPTNQGNRGFAIKNVNDRYVALFDDLYVRGAMNVHLFVINQIRATNGSLWVTDAAKATSASISGNDLYLYFESGSTLPFQGGDIIRSKRWIITDDEISNWDIITVVQLIDYPNFIVTASLLSVNCYTASNLSLPNLLQAAGSLWVRIGNIYIEDRMGGIYLTSGDNNSPYIDIYDGVLSIALSHNLDSGSVHYDKLKVRLGKLLGVSLGGFDNMSGYGLYSDNVYLKGTISATAGNLGGWLINSDHIYKDLYTYGYQQQDGYIKIGALANGGFGYLLSTSGNRAYLGVNDWGNPEFILHNINQDLYFKYQNSVILIKTPNFTLSNDALTLTGSINATSGNFVGSVTANTGYIGGTMGWQIEDGYITSSGILIKGGLFPAIKIGASGYSGNGIWLGKGNYYSASFWNTSNARGLKWDGQKLTIQAENFSLDTNGKISANLAVISGTITTSAGLFGGWTINSGGISSVHSYGTVSITKSGTSNLALTDTYGNFTYSAANSHMFTNKTNLYLVASASFTSTTTKYESDLNITTANPNKGFGIQFTDWCQDSGTPLIVFEINNIDEGVLYTLQSKVINPKYTASLHHVSSLFFQITSDSNPSSNVIFINTENPLWKRYSSENEILKQYKFSRPKGVGGPKVYLWLMGTMRPLLEASVGIKPTFTFSGFRIDSFKQYTLLSLKGLLVFNTPLNYIQLVSENGSTTNSSQASLGLANIETLHVNGISVNSALTTPRPVALGGTGTSSFANHQFLWYDTSSGMITASGFSSSSGGGSGMTDYNGVELQGANVISNINITSGVMTTASRVLTAANISAAATSTTVTGTGLLGGGGNLTENRTITHNIANGAYHLPANGSAGLLIMYSGTAGSGSWTSNIQTTGTASFASITASAGIKVNEAYYINTTSILTTDSLTVVATLTFSGVSAGFFDYIVLKGGSYYRAASITACKDASNAIIYTEFGIVLTGSVPITMSVRGDTNKISLIVTNGNTGTCKVLARGM